MDILHDKGVWKLAAQLIETHGAKAAPYAARQARDAIEYGDCAQHGVWLAVL